MSDKILTVIVPSYNMEKYLPKCLGSLVVVPELMEKLEVIVINDGSKDRTSEIAHEFEAQYPQSFKVIDKPNGNYGSCVNAALRAMKGGYVRVLDADDSVDPKAFAEYLHDLVHEFCKGDDAADLVVTDYVSVNSDGNVQRKHNYGLEGELRFTLSEAVAEGIRFTIHSITYRSKILKEIDYRQTEGISYTDTEWIVEPMARVRSVLHIPVCVTRYLVGREGQTTEDVTFARRFGQVVQISQNMVDRYGYLINCCVDESKSYYEEQIDGVLRMVYYVSLFGWNGFRVDVNIIEFDQRISPHKELYKRSSRFSIKPKILPTIEYVRVLRTKSIIGRLILALYGYYIRLVARFK